MKKAFSILAVCLIPLLSQAQLSGGKILLGGNFGLTSAKIKPKDGSGERSQTDFRFSPSLGLFLSDKTALGLFAEYQSVNTEADLTDSQNTLSTTENLGTVGLFLRHYTMSGERFAYFSQLDAGLVFGNNVIETTAVGSSSSNKEQSKVSGGRFGFTPGFTFFPSDKVGLELKWGRIGYQKLTVTPVDSQDQAQSDLAVEGSEFTLDFGLSTVNVGIQFYLGKGKE